mmetsp:Transcript_24147/g.60152  ORF Transcript_24147/g.60152 Transcript_24147/m.60152 type:complete len:197 (-) Transcript_24147:129-719(-)
MSARRRARSSTRSWTACWSGPSTSARTKSSCSGPARARVDNARAHSRLHARAPHLRSFTLSRSAARSSSPATHPPPPSPFTQADAPDPSKIPPEDLLGVTVVILSCHYREKEFVRIGYYVSNEYDDPELRDNPPKVLLLDRVVRNVLHDKPRVTKYDIPWDDIAPIERTAEPIDQPMKQSMDQPMDTLQMQAEPMC